MNLQTLVRMQPIQSPTDALQMGASTYKLLKQRSLSFTTDKMTAIVLQSMGKYYYISTGIYPEPTTVERLLEPTELVPMRAAPKMLQERLDYLAGKLPYSSPAAKTILYRALASTPELKLLDELEGQTHVPNTTALPFGLTRDAQQRIREIHHIYR